MVLGILLRDEVNISIVPIVLLNMWGHLGVVITIVDVTWLQPGMISRPFETVEVPSSINNRPEEETDYTATQDEIVAVYHFRVSAIETRKFSTVPSIVIH